MTHIMLVSTVDKKERLEWDSDDPAAVAEVKEEFDRIIGHNFAYAVKETGNEQIREFDPTAREIRVSHQLVGG